MTSAACHQDDVVAWATEQARFLREGRLDLLDIAHLAEEIEDVGKREQRDLAPQARRTRLVGRHLG